jgi:hypothetical protein
MNENTNDMTAPKLRIATYAQQCGLHGEWVRTWDGETESDDYHVHEGTREELLEEADRWEASGRKIGAGEGLYRIGMARAIREAVE